MDRALQQFATLHPVLDRLGQVVLGAGGGRLGLIGLVDDQPAVLAEQFGRAPRVRLDERSV
jgi:hypothetical protein